MPVPQAVAAAELLAPRGNEGHAAVGQVARVGVLDEHGLSLTLADHRVRGRTRDLPDLAGLEGVFVDEIRPMARTGTLVAGDPVAGLRHRLIVVMLRRMVGEGEQHALGVVGEIGMDRAARRQLARQPDRLSWTVLPVLQHDQTRGLPAVSAKILIAHVLGQEARTLVDQQLWEVQRRVREDDFAPQIAGADVECFAVRIALRVGELFFQHRQFRGQLRTWCRTLDHFQRPARQRQSRLDVLHVEQIARGLQLRHVIASPGNFLRGLLLLAATSGGIAPRQIGQLARFPVGLPDADPCLKFLLPGIDRRREGRRDHDHQCFARGGSPGLNFGQGATLHPELHLPDSPLRLCAQPALEPLGLAVQLDADLPVLYRETGVVVLLFPDNRLPAVAHAVVREPAVAGGAARLGQRQRHRLAVAPDQLRLAQKGTALAGAAKVQLLHPRNRHLDLARLLLAGQLDAKRLERF
jgi:hypothetical protein